MGVWDTHQVERRCNRATIVKTERFEGVKRSDDTLCSSFAANWFAGLKSVSGLCDPEVQTFFQGPIGSFEGPAGSRRSRSHSSLLRGRGCLCRKLQEESHTADSLAVLMKAPDRSTRVIGSVWRCVSALELEPSARTERFRPARTLGVQSRYITSPRRSASTLIHRLQGSVGAGGASSSSEENASFHVLHTLEGCWKDVYRESCWETFLFAGIWGFPFSRSKYEEPEFSYSSSKSRSANWQTSNTVTLIYVKR